ncbi:MAG: DUF4340 domain-containing protein [Candidatus Sedimenticola sp. (ex Thyasira tokunagai)]
MAAQKRVNPIDMGSRSKKNLALLVLVIILGALVWFSGEQEERERLPPLTDIDPAAVKVIRISNNNGPEFTMEHLNGRWKMTTPHHIAANQPRINILLDLLSTPSIEQQPLPLDRLGEFGLEQPVAKVVFNNTQITFGGTHPYNYRRYLRIGDNLHLIDDLFPHHVLARAEAFISHELFTPEQKIREIETPEWRLFQGADNTWQLNPPHPGISNDRLTEKVDQWQHTWVARIEPPPKESPSAEVKVWLNGQPNPVVLGVVQQKKSTLLVSAELGLAYRLPAAELLQTPAPE